MNDMLATNKDAEYDSFVFQTTPPSLPRVKFEWYKEGRVERVKLNHVTAEESRAKFGHLKHKIRNERKVITDKGYLLEWRIVDGKVWWMVIGQATQMNYTLTLTE